MHGDDWPEMMTTEEVAPRLRMSEAGVRRLIRRGEIQGTRIGRRWLVSKAEVLRVLREGTTPVELAGGRMHPRTAPPRADDEEPEEPGERALPASGARRYVFLSERVVPRVIG